MINNDLLHAYLEMRKPASEKELADWWRKDNPWPKGFEHPWARAKVLDELLAEVAAYLEQRTTQSTETQVLRRIVAVLREINHP